MFAPLTPILPADSQANVVADSIVARIDALQTVLAITARLAGFSPGGLQDGLSMRADLPDGISLMPTGTSQALTRALDSIAMALHAGLLALDKARMAGRLNHAAAALLHAECTEALAGALVKALASIGYPPQG